ncbi:MAG: hypothetical protein JF621_04430 [Streptomyces turgidiscabies]|nr:hypothetical protein [Streptomyces turgidiscabies]
MLLDPPAHRLGQLPAALRLPFAHAPAAHYSRLGPMTVTGPTRPPIAVLTGPWLNVHHFVRSADGTAVTRNRVPVVAADSRDHHTPPVRHTPPSWAGEVR